MVNFLEVTISIPIIAKNKDIWNVLKDLQNQSYKDFSVLIIAKLTEGDEENARKLREYKKLDIDVITHRGYYEDSMNLILGNAHSSLVINTDDDVVLSKNFVRDHLNMHRRQKKLGIARGECIDIGMNTDTIVKNDRLYNLKCKIDSLVDKPVSPKFCNYDAYIGNSGMLVNTGVVKTGLTIRQRGVNMSWKREALEGFRFPSYTIRAMRNEAMASVEAINRGFYAKYFHGAKIWHKERVSLTRNNKDLRYRTVLIMEDVLLSYYMSRIFDIDINLLRTRCLIGSLYEKLSKGIEASDGYKSGYNLTIDSIRNNTKPKDVRKALLKIIQQPATSKEV